MPINNLMREAIKNAKEPFISMANCGLFDEDMPELVELINANPNIHYIDLEYNNYGDIGAESLFKLKHVHGLILSKTDIADKGAILLMSHPNFKELDFSYCLSIEDEAGEYAKENAHQTKLNLYYTYISEPLLSEINERTEIRRKAAMHSLKKESVLAEHKDEKVQKNKSALEEQKDEKIQADKISAKASYYNNGKTTLFAKASSVNPPVIQQKQSILSRIFQFNKPGV